MSMENSEEWVSAVFWTSDTLRIVIQLATKPFEMKKFQLLSQQINQRWDGATMKPLPIEIVKKVG